MIMCIMFFCSFCCFFRVRIFVKVYSFFLRSGLLSLRVVDLMLDFLVSEELV